MYTAVQIENAQINDSINGLNLAIESLRAIASKTENNALHLIAMQQLESLNKINLTLKFLKG